MPVPERANLLAMVMLPITFEVVYRARRDEITCTEEGIGTRTDAKV